MNARMRPLNRAIASTLAATTGAGAATAAETASNSRLEEIVVTATKRAEPMQDIPVSVQALSSEGLDELGIDSFEEYARYLPNVVFSGRGPGQAEIYIRGAATQQSSITVSSVQGSAPAVALYQDEQPVSFGGRNLDVYVTDMERIEVLPGPQGTLFGASSQTGTVRLITNKPRVGEFEAGFDLKTSFTDGGEPSNSVEAFLNLPVSDAVAVRVAAYNDRQGGWIDNVPGTYTGDIEVMNRNQIAAAICTGDVTIDNPACGGTRATMARADNSTLVESDFNDATYSGVRLGVAWDINDNWSALVQHTRQTLETEGVFEYDPNLSGESSVNRFTPSRNEDEFGLTTWTLTGRLWELDVVYTGGYLDREVYYVQDYTGYTNGGGYQAYYICTGGYTSYSECFDPTKQYLGDTANERFTNEFRISTDPTRRIRATAGIYIDTQETNSVGQFQYFGTIDAGYDVATAPGTITNPANAAPTDANIVSTVPGVNNPFGRGPQTTFVNDFSRNEDQIAFFGEVTLDITDDVSFGIGARNYNIDYEFIGSTGSSFGCKFATTSPCDGQGFDNRVSERLDALGAFAARGDTAALESFFGAGGAADIQAAVADGSFFVDGLESDGVINQSDTIFRSTLNWHVTDDIMVFGAYSEGFRPQTANRNAGQGANNPNNSPIYDGYRVPAIARTDELTNWEVGLKGTFLDGNLRVNATAYTSEIEDLQVSRFDPANVAFLVFIENVGDAEINGLDADFTWGATDNLTISGGMSLVDNEISRLNPQLDEVAVPVGSRLPYTPEFRGNLRARYDFVLEAFDAEAWVRGGIVYTGESPAQISCDAFFAETVMQRVYGTGSGLQIQQEGGFCGPALAGGDLALATPGFVGTDGNGDTRYLAARYVQESYTLVDLGIGVYKNGWTAELFVDNITNENAQLNVNTTDYVPRVTTNRPRTVGLRLGYRFE